MGSYFNERFTLINRRIQFQHITGRLHIQAAQNTWPLVGVLYYLLLLFFQLLLAPEKAMLEEKDKQVLI